MVDSQESKAIVRAIIRYGPVIAEGVETEDQLNAVAKAGCEMAQGYFFSHPLDSFSISRLLSVKPTRLDDKTYSISM